MDEEWLREELSRVVPDPPSARPRLTAVLGRRRRHRNRVRGVLAAAVVVLLVGVGFAAAVMVTRTQGNLAPASSVPEVDVACPGSFDPAEPEVIRLDKVLVARLCPVGAGAAEPGLTDIALRTGVTQLANVVARSSVATRAQRCRTVADPTYQLVFGYDDGEEIVSEIDLDRCETVVTGPAVRKNPVEVVRAFRQLIDAQAESLRASSTGEKLPPCPEADAYAAAATSPEADPSALSSARVCLYGRPGSKSPGLQRSTDVPPDRIQDLGSDIDHGNGRQGDYCPGGEQRILVLGLTSDGDVLNLVAYTCMAFELIGRYPYSTWSPSKAIEPLLIE